jgi:hypothetical protein
MERQQRDLHLDADDDSVVSKLQLSIKLRVSALTDLGMKKDTLSLEQIKSLSDIVSALFVTKVVGRFPIDLSKFQSELARRSPAYAANDDDDGESSSAMAFGSVANSASVSADHKDALDGVAQGTLLPPPNILSPNFNCLVLEIDRIGLKDAENYIDARLTVTVTDASGHPLEQAQETPISNRKKPQYVMFGNTVYIQTPLERLPEGLQQTQFRLFAILSLITHFLQSQISPSFSSSSTTNPTRRRSARAALRSWRRRRLPHRQTCSWNCTPNPRISLVRTFACTRSSPCICT